VRIETPNPGTGCIVGMPLGAGHHAAFIVTCKHVIAPAGNPLRPVTLWLHREKDGKPDLGNPFLAPVDQWFCPADRDWDLAIAPLQPVVEKLESCGSHVFYHYIHFDQFFSDSELERLDVFEPVAFAGYPNGLVDRENMLPIVRRGSIATMPCLDWQGDPVFLIDGSVFPGSSGSPVIVLPKARYVRGEEEHDVGELPMMLGILSHQLPAKYKGVEHFLDLGVVVRTSAIKPLIFAFLAHAGCVAPSGRIRDASRPS